MERGDHDRLTLGRVAIELECFLADGAGVIVFHLAGAWAPAEVDVVESAESVRIGLWRRTVMGTYSDGAVAADSLAGHPACLSIALSTPLGDRRVLDASTSRPVARLGERPDDDHFRALGTRDCPRWEP